MHVLTVITRQTGAVPLARLGYRVARAIEAKLVILCIESGEASGEPLLIVPGDPIPEGSSAVVGELCRVFERRHEDELGEAGDEDPKLDRILPAPPVEVRWLRTTRRLQAVLEQVADVDADYLLAAKQKPREKAVPLARKLFTAAPCHMILACPPRDSPGIDPSRLQPPSRPPAPSIARAFRPVWRRHARVAPYA